MRPVFYTARMAAIHSSATPAANTARQEHIELLEQEAKRLEERIQALNHRILSLQEEADQRRRDMVRAFRDRYAAKFKDFDAKRALAGYTVEHEISVFGASYVVSPPMQADISDVDIGIQKEGLQVTPSERILLCWLDAVGVKPDLARLSDRPLKERLALIRKLPEQMILKLAEECSALDTYLGAVLEIELGNL